MVALSFAFLPFGRRLLFQHCDASNTWRHRVMRDGALERQKVRFKMAGDGTEVEAEGQMEERSASIGEKGPRRPALARWAAASARRALAPLRRGERSPPPGHRRRAGSCQAGKLAALSRKCSSLLWERCSAAKMCLKLSVADAQLDAARCL